jgi:FKBP-type peptidyl-prolyl cis-trans isomerase
VTSFHSRFGILLISATLGVFSLAGCGPKSPPEPAAGPASPAAGAAEVDAKAQELAAKEQELAEREAALKAEEEAAQKQKDLEAELARRDAENAAAAAAEKEKAAAAAKAASAKKSSTTKTAATGAGAAAAKPAAEPPKPIVVPAGTQLAISLGTALSTKTSKVGDKVNGQLSSDLVIDGRKAASAGTPISGSVYKVISGSDRVGTTPKLTLIFDSLVASNGATVPIAAKFQQLGKSEKGKDTAKIVGGAAAGAIIGNQVKGGGGGSVVGGLLGAGAGTAVASKTGNEVEVPAGTVVTASTTAEFQVKPK